MDVKPEKEFVVHGLQIIFHFKPITQMAYKKLEKPAGLVEAKTRLQAMQNIDTKESAPVEYGHTGDPINATSLDTSIKDIESDISTHNKHLQDADAIKNQIQQRVKALGTFHARVLKSAVGKFGPNHNYVELLGGTRQQERKKPQRKPKTPQ